jgi:hypothetical protein
MVTDWESYDSFCATKLIYVDCPRSLLHGDVQIRTSFCKMGGTYFFFLCLVKFDVFSVIDILSKHNYVQFTSRKNRRIEACVLIFLSKFPFQFKDQFYLQM